MNESSCEAYTLQMIRGYTQSASVNILNRRPFDITTQLTVFTAGLIILLVAVMKWLRPISKNPIQHIVQSVKISAKTANYVKSSDSVYLDQAVMYNGKRMHIQPLLISPTNPINNFLIMSLADELRDLIKLYPINQQNGIQFITPTRLNITNWDAVSCDFCSIFNGFCHWMDSAFTKHPNYIMHLPDSKRTRINNILDQLAKFICLYINCGPPQDESKIDLKEYITKCQCIQAKVKWIMQNLESIELRYCPFKAFSNYYRNADHRYIPINHDTILHAGKILDSQQTIECYMCSQIINQNMDKKMMKDVDQDSPMIDLMNYVIKEQ